MMLGKIVGNVVSDIKIKDYEGLKILVEQINHLRNIEGVAGVHVMAIEWESAVKGIVEKAGLLPRPEVTD